MADSAKIRCSPRSFFAKDNGRCTGLSMVKKRQRRVVAALLHARRLTSCCSSPPCLHDLLLQLTDTAVDLPDLLLLVA